MEGFDNDLGKTDLQKSIESQAEKEAVEIEKGSYNKTKAARLKLEKAAEKQKGTTNEMRMANENLEEAKKAGIKTYSHAKKARMQATELSNEQNAFNPLAGAQTKVSKWMDKDAQADEDINRIANRTKDDNDLEDNNNEEVNVFKGGSFKEEKQTNQELNKILNVVKGIEKETSVQKNEGQKQKTNLEDILKTAEYSKKETEFANEKLQAFNKKNK